MKKVTHFLLFTFVAAIFITCKKQEITPSSTEGQPVFSFYGNMGGNILNIQAGVNNYYMYSSYSQGNNNLGPDGYGIYSFTGTLQNTSTPNNSIQITLNDDMLIPTGNPSDISNSIVAGNTYYYTVPGGTPVSESVSFTPKVYAGTATSFSYTFGDGSTAYTTNANPVNHVYKSLKDYNTQLQVNFNGGNPSPITITNPLQINSKSTTPLTVDSVHTSLLTDYSHKHEVSLWAYVSGGTSPYTYKWHGKGLQNDTNSIISGKSINTIYTYTTEPASMDTITLSVTDYMQKDSASFTFNYTDTVSKNNRVVYSMSVPQPVSNPYGFSNVTVNYTDGQGNQYTSNNPSQSRNSNFQITSVSNYQNNMNNSPTKMLKITFNCMLYNAARHDSIAATNCMAVIAVAYH